MNKETLLDRILTNPVYSADSGLSQQLRQSLSRLSLVALGQLATLIDCREARPANQGGGQTAGEGPQLRRQVQSRRQ